MRLKDSFPPIAGHSWRKISLCSGSPCGVRGRPILWHGRPAREHGRDGRATF
jgi:hypothetical protein